jgi:hypothetical protein
VLFRSIGKVMISSQKYFLAQCKYTFRLNDPICEVVKGSHPRSWYASKDDYWTIVFNGTDDLYSLLPSVKADADRSRWKIVVYVDAESPKDGGGGGGGWVGLPKHDADGAAGYPKDTARWCGGMCHELGHCFGLPDASYTDGTVMSASFYGWPNCVFTAGHISTMKNLPENAGFWTTGITQISVDARGTMPAPGQWTPYMQGNRLHVPFVTPTPFRATVGLYDLAGRRAGVFTTANAIAGIHPLSFDVSRLTVGSYMCVLENNGRIEQTAMVRKIK